MVQLQPTISVANYFIGKAQQEGSNITPMKLLKLVYIAHGWSLGLFGQPLIAEQVQAWRYGPVVTSVYREFRDYGRTPIRQQQTVLVSKDTGYALIIPTVDDEATCQLLDKVWNSYKHLSGLQLSDITHADGTPWDITWNQQGGSETGNTVIAPALIENHYRELAQKRSRSSCIP